MDAPTYKAMIFGAILLNALVVALYFFRSWKKTADRLFARFAAAFLLLAAERAALAFFSESQPLVYLIRLTAFAIIMYAIWEKNRASGAPRRKNRVELDRVDSR